MPKKIDECGMGEFGTLDNRKKTIAILGDKWWPQMTKEEGDKMSKTKVCTLWKKLAERPNVGGVY